MSHPFKTACAAIALFGCQALTAQEVIDFHRDIEPILQARCLSCHGPDEVESDFRVDRKATLIGGGGSGI